MQPSPVGTTGIAITPLVLGGNVFGWTADEPTSFAILDAFVIPKFKEGQFDEGVLSGVDALLRAARSEPVELPAAARGAADRAYPSLSLLQTEPGSRQANMLCLRSRAKRNGQSLSTKTGNNILQQNMIRKKMLSV